MQFTAGHMASLIATLVIVTGIGLSAARKVKTAADFTLGGKSSGVVLITGTIIGTIVGGASTVGTAQLAFSYGFSAWWFTLGAGIALGLLSVFYAGPLRSSGLQTIPQFLTANYGRAAGPITSLTSSAGIFFSIVANIMSAIPLVAAIFSFNLHQSAGLVFLLIVAYVFFGGVWGTGLVGVVKTLLIYLTLLTVTVVCWQGMGGIGGYLDVFPPYPWFSLMGRGWLVDLASALSLIVGTLSTQTYIQAVYAARDVQTAQKGALAAALITLPTGIPAVLAGMYMRAHHPAIAPIDALPLFILHYLPPWIGGIGIAALLLAAVGSAAGLALGVGTMLSRDIILPLRKTAGEQTMLWINRLMVLGITLLAAVFTFGNLKSLVLEWNFLSMGLRGAGIFLPLTFAVLFPGRVKKQAAILSMIVGAGVALVWKGVFPESIDPLYAGLLASGLAIVPGLWRGTADSKDKSSG
ncbi:sodium:solute symporter family protein [Acetonema longum]|uniref:Na+/proline symporter n=1 Tax=Acetonema longum DSM 6540 TaxID=1009370 RepID=F7NQ47_9FIRM|nr:sodium:solute symporter family protein [Acetonema longum]EGO61806.1 Na+/proline symporter [Acetonema longum DSM 6540]